MLYCSVLIRWNCGRNGKINNLQICICSVSSSLRNQPGSKSSVVWGFFYKLQKKNSNYLVSVHRPCTSSLIKVTSHRKSHSVGALHTNTVVFYNITSERGQAALH